MARAKRKKKLEDLPGQEDPRAPLDSEVLLKESQAVVKELRKDLTARAKDSAAVTEAFKARHAADKAAQRTADSFAQWQERFIEQVAAAWLLSCVFVRTLEDRGLLGRNRIAGEGAADSQRQFFEMAPSLELRDYLLMVFRELSRFPAAKDLFDAGHNPVWLLAPSTPAARALLGLFRTPAVDAPALRFGQEDTRFVGNLYQDLDEGVQKRYALLQTPPFVSSFILDRTLEPAIEKFGLDDTTMIDPTCGSGHFLLDGFERLFDHRLRAEPGLDVRQAARGALDAVFGADLNPYAVAISRFRLTLAFLEKAGFRKLAEAPELPLHLVVADSLLHNPHVDQLELGDREETSKAAWAGEEFALEDEAAARDVLHRKYAAVVGNPPYITVKDKVLRDRYRDMYASAFRTYSLAVPFTERFFQLGRDSARVGMITANSFMKREFGTKLIEDYLPSVNVDAIVNTSGAYIPGHGTPTVLLFGSADVPQAEEVLTVLANRGEPSTPDEPEQGRVWQSIAQHWSETGFENDFVSVTRTKREALAHHPWALSGGGAGELKALLEERAGSKLASHCSLPIGRAARSGADEVFMLPRETAARLGVPEDWYRPLILGEVVRDWAAVPEEVMFFPYGQEPPNELRPLGSAGATARAYRLLWPYRTLLADRSTFQGKMKDAGRAWYEYMQYTASANWPPMSITFAFVATHNHFVLDRGGKVFNRTAPIIKLPDTATEDDHLALVAYLNSSTACFWMKQVFFDKGSGTDKGKWQDEPARIAYEFAGTGLAAAPLPPGRDRELTVRLARRMSDLSAARERLIPDALGRSKAPQTTLGLDEELARLEAQDERILGHLVALQEELDWRAYAAWGLTADDALLDASLAASETGVPIGLRPFEIRAARTGSTIGIDGQPLLAELPREWPAAVRELWERRIEAIDSNREIRLLEQPLYKRRWLLTPKNLGGRTLTFADRSEEALRQLLATRVEATLTDASEPKSLKKILQLLACDAPAMSMAAHLSEPGPDPAIERVLADSEIPFLARLRFKPAGDRKSRQWEATWAAQRVEDAGRSPGEVPVPPKYASGDYLKTSYWELRGKLDVPKESFISYPGCESDEDGEPIYGWAGWDHEQRAKALATLYWNRKTEEGWETPRLTPMLAGLLELLPWLHQWHADKSDDYGGDSPANYFQGFLDAQCAELGLSHDDLRAWRPPEKKKGGRRKKAAKKKDKDA